MEIGVKAVIALAMFLVVIAIAGWLAWDMKRAHRNARLRARILYGKGRPLRETGRSERAEPALESPVTRIEHFEIRPLSRHDAQRLTEDWRAAQGLFLDRPLTAVTEAESLIRQVMRLRGYPMGDFEARAAELWVDHPRVVEHYREAHRLALLSQEGAADTEDLRLAMMHCRALFDELVGEAYAPVEEFAMAR